MTRICLAAALFLLLPGTASALQLGVQDDGEPGSTVLANTDLIGGTWTRTTVYVGQRGVAQRIRDAHAEGKRIILTVGGVGTITPRPTSGQLLRYVRSLPRADKYGVINEPDLLGLDPCVYRRRWLIVRRVLGSRLGWGDFSPHAPLTYTQAALRCGRLPRHLDFLLHPYDSGDPLRPAAALTVGGNDFEGGLSQLSYARRWLRRSLGISVVWWLDEFGYAAGSVPDGRAAWLWPRAIRQARRQGARVLIAYTAQGPTWDTRPRPLAWCSLSRGWACPGADSDAPTPRGADPIEADIFAYANEEG